MSAPADPDPGDALTILRCEPGRRAAKLIRRRGEGVELLGYDAGAWFAVDTVAAPDVETFAAELDRASRDALAYVVRGEPLPGADRRRCRRLLHRQEDGAGPTFREVPRRWVLLDFDSVAVLLTWDWRDGALSALHLRSLLPPEFHGVSFWWQFTGGAGFKPGLRMRLGFRLSRHVTGGELGRWLARAPVDHAVFRPVQAVYVAHPVLRGVRDPLPERSGLEWDFRDEVEVPELPEPVRPPPAERQAERRGGLRAMPAHRHGWPFAVLEQVARGVAGTPASGLNPWGGGGRHHALYCGALRLSGIVGEGRLDPAQAVRVLAAAARTAGIKGEGEIARTIKNGFRAGGLPA